MEHALQHVQRRDRADARVLCGYKSAGCFRVASLINLMLRMTKSQFFRFAVNPAVRGLVCKLIANKQASDSSSGGLGPVFCAPVGAKSAEPEMSAPPPSAAQPFAHAMAPGASGQNTAGPRKLAQTLSAQDRPSSGPPAAHGNPHHEVRSSQQRWILDAVKPSTSTARVGKPSLGLSCDLLQGTRQQLERR